MIVTYSIVDNNFLDTVQNGVKANLVSFLEKNYKKLLFKYFRLYNNLFENNVYFREV